MEELFINEGYKVVDFNRAADVYVINTCTVTHHGDSKSRQVIRRAKRKNPDAVVVVMGCYVQVSPDEVMALQGVDVVMGTADKSRVVSLVEEAGRNARPIKLVRDFKSDEDFEELTLKKNHRGRTRAFVKVQEGCRQFCTYCIIPYARGPLRSRPAERVLGQIERLVELGYREVVLTGIHVTSYGTDHGTDIDLLGLIKRVHQIPGLDRIRLSSLEPTYITPEFIEEIAGLQKVCRHFHLSLQSGYDETLKRMGRRYTTAEYREIVQRLKETLPGVAVTTDVMVGFPGETGQEFKKTYGFLEDLKLYNMHVFKYSPRKGTPAAAFADQVSARAKDERSSALIALAARCRKNFHDHFVGKSLKVLYEQRSGLLKGHYEGLTDNYIKVLVPTDQNLNNRLIETRLLESREDYMLGRL
ncbi:MAG: tRNA (N(6)-L-threonylcarbamoyladenosine(37)-C(2))-methylthiotransferase MtaB [Bacillota bacterium]